MSQDLLAVLNVSDMAPLEEKKTNFIFHVAILFQLDHPERRNRSRGRMLFSHSIFPPTLFSTANTVTVSSRPSTVISMADLTD